MTFEVRLRTEAEQDLANAATWYEEQREGLGHEFLDSVLGMLASIAEAPLMYPNAYRNTRRGVIYRFPFCVYFRVENEAVVVAVMHGGRNPRRWKDRA